MARYSLSQDAAGDLDRLFDYGIDHFGFDLACSYFREMEERFMDPAMYPLQYQAVDHIRYRHSVLRAHSIYYRFEGSQILFMRIFSREDPSKEL